MRLLCTGLNGDWKMAGKFHYSCAYSLSFQPNQVQFGMVSTDASTLMKLVGVDTSPATFSLGNSSQITFSTTSVTGLTQQWTTVGGSGIATYTVYETNPRRVSGTFRCQAVPANNPTTSTQEVTGTFSNAQY